MAKKKFAKKPAKSMSKGKAAAPARKTPLTPASKQRPKGEVYRLIAEHTDLTRKQVAAVFETAGEIISKDLSRSGPGVVNLGGMMKVMVVRKPATKAAQRPNPFKPGEMMTVKAKPARNVVKVRPLKALKSMV